MVFVGVMIGNLFWGAFADKYGRKRVSSPHALYKTCTHLILLCFCLQALALVCAGSAAFGILSAFSPNFYWMVFLRMLLGVVAGGSGQR